MATPKSNTVTSPAQASKALAKVSSTVFMALEQGKAFAQRLGLVLEENLGGGTIAPFDFTSVKIPSGGGTSWQLPTLDGGIENVEELRGILLYRQSVREFYAEKYDGAGGPPNCFSPDCKIGYGNPGGICAKCPHSQFGTATDAQGKPGKGQACGERRHLLLLPEDNMLPLFVNLPPTSIGSLKNFTMLLSGQGTVWYQVECAIGLTQDKAGQGITFSKTVFKLIGRLNDDKAEIAKLYHDAITEALAANMADAAGRRSVGDETAAPEA